MTTHAIPVSSDNLHVALDCEADRAEHEGLIHCAERQRATALHVRNAVHHMTQLCPEGFRVETHIVVSHVPDVNPILRDEVRQ